MYINFWYPAGLSAEITDKPVRRRMLAQDYAMVPHALHPLEGTMCQHDFEGRRVFQHRNMLKWKPNGFTQNVSGCSGSRTVMCPATPSSKPIFENSRNAAASRRFRCTRSSAGLSNTGG